MKRYILFSVLIIWALSSCSREEKVTIEDEERSGISLNLVCSEPTTKAGKDGTRPGDDDGDYNENLIKTIDYFFYPEGGTDQNSVLHKRELVNSSSSYTLNITVDANLVNSRLFPGTSRVCKVAVIINYPDDIDHSTSVNTTLDDIKNKPLNTNFKASPNSPIQPQFVMFGIADVNLISKTQKLVAAETVDMHRVASKVTLNLHIEPSVTDTLRKKLGGVERKIPQVWEPNYLDPTTGKPLIDPETGKHRLMSYLQNALMRAVLSGDFSALTDVVSADFFKYSQTPFKVTNGGYYEEVSRNEKNYLVSYPFYTYPQTWQPNEYHEPFLKIVLPWTRKAGSYQYEEDGQTKEYSWGERTKQYYYRVILPNSSGFVSNNWYHIYLDLAVLGSETDEAEIEIEGQYYVQDWADAEDKTADIKSARYLSVSQNEFSMYNTTELKIPYKSSHSCSYDIISAERYNFVTESYDNLKTQAANWISLDSENNIVINHTLNNDVSTSNFDVAPYVFKIRLYHNDNSSYEKIVTVTQYPAMYIEEKSSKNGRVYIKSSSYSNNNGANSIYDDGGTTGTTFMGSLDQKSSVDQGTGYNSNTNQYTIHVSVLPEDDPNSIGDPRISTGISGTETTSLVYRLDNLTNYRATANDTQDLIAPVFKVASSYGRTSYMTYEGAAKRCAAYQENGYPAGRWRLPTKAEMSYLMNLSDKGKIPTLFDPEPTDGYWAGGKYFMIKDNRGDLQFIDANISGTSYSGQSTIVSNVTYHVYTRCVYDVWYWGDNQDAPLTSWGGYMTTPQTNP